MEKNNARFSTGRMLADTLKSTVRNEEHALDQTDKESKLQLIKTKKEFGPVLERVGLGIESVETGSAVFSSAGEAKETEIRFNIDDRQKFINYLQELDPDSISENQIKGLKSVLESMVVQLEREYQLENAEDDRMIELLGGLEAILGECERLDPSGSHGLVQSIEKLKKYNQAAKEKYLQELLLVERDGLMLEIGGQNYCPST